MNEHKLNILWCLCVCPTGIRQCRISTKGLKGESHQKFNFPSATGRSCHTSHILLHGLNLQSSVHVLERIYIFILMFISATGHKKIQPRAVGGERPNLISPVPNNFLKHSLIFGRQHCTSLKLSELLPSAWFYCHQVQAAWGKKRGQPVYMGSTDLWWNPWASWPPHECWLVQYMLSGHMIWSRTPSLTFHLQFTVQYGTDDPNRLLNLWCLQSSAIYLI